MKKLLSMVLCAMMALTLAGCGGSGGDSSTYTFSSELDIKNLDSSDADDGCSFTAMHAVIDGLMKTDKKGNIVNGVASSSEVSDDGLTHTYKIRKDAKWANGDPVTANDFVYAWHRIFQKKGQYYYMFCDGIASIVGAQEMSDKIDNEEDITDADLDAMGVKAVDDKTLEITLEYSVPYFLSLTDTRAMYPVREDLVEKYGESYGANVESMVGCGPFKMTSWKRNSKIELEKNENYWDKDSVKLDKVNYQIVSDQTARFNSFDSGSLDYVACADKEWIGRFDKKDKVDVVEAPIPTVRYDFFNCQDKIFSNVNIRKAFTMAVNREDMCSVIYNDIHKPLYGWIPYSTSTGELGEYRDQVEEPLKSITEDPKELLLKGMQELGLGSDPSTLNITYTLSGTTEWTRTYAAYCQQMWEKILGVKVELDFNEWGTFQSKTNNGEFQIAMMTWSIDYDDPMAMMEVFAGGSNMVPVFWQNEQYDSLVAQARKEMDEKTRVDLYKQAENILLAEDCVVSPNVNECTHSYYYQYVKNYNKLASSTSGLKYVDTSAR